MESHPPSFPAESSHMRWASATGNGAIPTDDPAFPSPAIAILLPDSPVPPPAPARTGGLAAISDRSGRFPSLSGRRPAPSARFPNPPGRGPAPSGRFPNRSGRRPAPSGCFPNRSGRQAGPLRDASRTVRDDGRPLQGASRPLQDASRTLQDEGRSLQDASRTVGFCHFFEENRRFTPKTRFPSPSRRNPPVLEPAGSQTNNNSNQTTKTQNHEKTAILS